MKRKLAAAEKTERKRRKMQFSFVLIGGKMKRVRHTTTVEGIPIEEFIIRNGNAADLIEMNLFEHLLTAEEKDQDSHTNNSSQSTSEDDDLFK